MIDSHDRSMPAALPEGWVWTTLGELIDRVEAGKSPKAENRPAGEGEYGVLKVSAMSWGEFLPEENKALYTSELSSNALTIRAGDLLFSRANTVELVGAVVLVQRDYPNLVLSDKSLRLVPTTNGVLTKWLLYALRGPNARRHLEQSATGTSDSMRNISQEKLRQTPIPLAPLAEQRRIVETIEVLFTQLEAGVAALKQARRKVRRYRASVLKVACEGRLVPQDPADEPAAVLLRRILAERRAKWQGKGKYKEPAGPDTRGLPQLPSNWCYVSAEQCTSRITDGEHITPERSEDGILLLSARNVQDGWLSLKNVDFVPQHVYEVISQRLTIEAGDVLMSCSGTVGRSCVAPENLTFALVRSVAVLKPFMNMGKFLSYAIRSPLLQLQIDSKKTQTAQANIFQGKIKTLVFPLPPLAEQQRIVAEVERRLSVAAALEQSIDATLKRAARLRQSILKRAFSGLLVPQDPADESASALLVRIRRERAKAGKAKQRG